MMCSVLDLTNGGALPTLNGSQTKERWYAKVRKVLEEEGACESDPRAWQSEIDDESAWDFSRTQSTQDKVAKR